MTRLTSTAYAIRQAISTAYAIIASRITDSNGNPATLDCALKIIFLIPLWILGSATTKLDGKQIDNLIYTRLIALFNGQFQLLHNSSPHLNDSTPHTPQQGTQQQSTTSPALPSHGNASHIAAKHIRSGNISRALNILCPNLPIADPNHPDTQSMLTSVFPDANTPPAQTHISTTGLTAPVFADKDVYQIIATSKRGTGAGISGLRFDHLRSLLDHNISPSITIIINTLISGKLILDQSIGNAAATLLLKDNNTVRPIMVLETFIRIIGRLIDQRVTGKIAAALKHQFAIHNKSAITQVPTALRIVMANCPDKLTLKVDLRNAFGTIDRAYLSQRISALTPEHPALAHYWNLIYAKANAAITRGTAKHQATTGVLQGDPLATLFFCIGISKALIDTGAILNNDELIFAYVDDIPMVVSSDNLTPTLKALYNNLAPIGLTVMQHRKMSNISTLCHCSDPKRHPTKHPSQK